jgi:hypothetical protein
MQSLKTLYRVVVMAATIVIVVQAWKLYGPTFEQLNSLVLRGLDMAKGGLGSAGEPLAAKEGPAPQSNASLTEAPPLAAASGQAAPPLAERSSAEFGANQPDQARVPTEGAPITPISALSADTSQHDPNGLQGLFAQLEKLGARDPKLDRWGASGQLYRFCCQAAWGESAQFYRHFESIAEEPTIAVQQVLAQVDAWRTAQRGTAGVR